MKRLFACCSAALCLLLLQRCSLFTASAPPFPESVPGEAPFTERATWGAAKTVAWDEPDARGVAVPGQEAAIWTDASVTSAPADGWNAFGAPPAEESFIIVQTPLGVSDLRSLPALTFSFSASLLGLPERALTAPPRAGSDALCGVLQFDRNGLLADASIEQILSDRHGRIWTAGSKGLCMFDGEFLSMYTSAQGLASSAPVALAEDDAGRIWIGHPRNGIDVIDPERGTISHADTRHGLPDERIRSIARDSAGHMLLCTESGLSILDPLRGRAQHVTAAQAKGFGWSTPGAHLATAPDGDIWVSTTQGISIVSLATGLLSELRLKSGVPVPGGGTMLRGSGGVVWIGHGGGGLDGYDGATLRVTRLGAAQGLSSPPIALAQGRDGIVWAGTRDAGLQGFDLTERRGIRIDRTTGLGDNSAQALLADDGGNLWIGGTTGALGLIPQGGLQWTHHRMHGARSPRSLPCVLAEGSSRIWSGTTDGKLLLLDTESGRRRTLAKAATHLLRAANGELWISTMNGVLVLDTSLATLRNIGRKQGLGGVNVSCCAQLRDGSMLVATRDGGLTHADAAFTRPRRLGAGQGLASSAVQALCETRDGRIWIGTESGLDVYTPGDGTVRHATLGSMREQASIIALAQDDAGRIWIGTEGDGLAVLDEEKDRLLRYTDASGLPGMQAASFLLRGADMWCGTSRGLAQFRPREGGGFVIRAYGSADGLPELACGRNAATLAADGSAWWGIGGVVTRLTPGPLPDAATPRAFITGIDIMERRESFLTRRQLERAPADSAHALRGAAPAAGERAASEKSWLRGQGIEWDGVEGPYALPKKLCLPAHAGHVTFSFSGGRPGNGVPRYRFVLEGNDAEWSAVTDRPQAEYRNLSPGTYTFTVHCLGANGRWSEPASFAFVIAPPLWRSWWAYSLYALLFVLFIVLGTREQKRRLFRRELAGARLRESEVRNALLLAESEREEALRSKSLDAEESARLLREAREERARFEQQVWQGLRAQVLSGEAATSDADLNALLLESAEAAERRIRTALPDFHCALHKDLAPGLPPLALAQHDLAFAVRAILLNAYEAVHGKSLAQDADSAYAPGIGVRSSLHGDRIEVLISDNGAGIPEHERERIFEPWFTTKADDGHSGLGLALAREIVAAQGGSIAVRSKTGVGTEFVISLPLAAS